MPATDGVPVAVPAADGVPVAVPATDGAPVAVPATDGVPVTVPAADGVPVAVPATDVPRVAVLVWQKGPVVAAVTGVMRPGTAALALLVAAALGAERFDRQQDLQPVAWLQQLPAPSLVSCTAYCAALSACGQVNWEQASGLCRLAQTTAAGGVPPADSPQLTLYRSAAVPPPPPTTAAPPPTTTAPLPTTTAPPPTTTAPPPAITAVDGRFYWHVTVSSALGYDDARAHCQSLMAGADMASLHTQSQLDFLWDDPARPSSTEFIGVTYENLGGVRKPRNPDGTDLTFDIIGYISGSGSRLVLPSSLAKGQLLRMSYSNTQLANMVCDSVIAPPSDVVAAPPSG